MAASNFPPRHWYLWFLGVHPDAQGQGHFRVRMISEGISDVELVQ